MQLQLEPGYEVAEQIPHQRIHHGGGFVVEHALGLGGQRSRDGNRTFHAGRKVGRQQVAHLLDSDHFEEAIDHLEDLLFGKLSFFAQGERNVFTDRQGIEEGSVLEHHGDFLADFFELYLVVVCNVLTGDNDPARIRLKKAHDVVERNRFSDAAAAKNTDHLTRQYLEVDVLENDPIAKCLGDVLKFDVGRDCVRGHGLSAWHEMPAQLKHKCRDSTRKTGPRLPVGPAGYSH